MCLCRTPGASRLSATGCPCGEQLAVDATLVSPLGRDEPQANADAHPGIVVAQATRRKQRQAYPELGRARRCRLVVFGLEVGGRWAPEAATFIRLLARARAAEVPTSLRAAARAAWVVRWNGILAVAAQRAFAASLLELPPGGKCSAGGPEPALHELLADARWQATPASSPFPCVLVEAGAPCTGTHMDTAGGKRYRKQKTKKREEGMEEQRCQLPCASPPAAPGYNDGMASFPSQHSEPLQHRCWSCRCVGGAMELARPNLRAASNSWRLDGGSPCWPRLPPRPRQPCRGNRTGGTAVALRFPG